MRPGRHRRIGRPVVEEVRERRPPGLGMGEGNPARKVGDRHRVEVERRDGEPDGAREAERVGAVSEVGDRDMVPEFITAPRHAARPRHDLDGLADQVLVGVVTRPQHHRVRAEGHGAPVCVGRRVADGQDLHGHPGIASRSFRNPDFRNSHAM